MAAQDMPPPGGFGSINIDRTFPKPLMRQGIYMLALIGLSINGCFYLKEWKKRYRTLKVEENEHYIAMSPFLYAEQDRKYLRRLKEMVKDEEELMKDVPGWTRDSLFGEKIYKTLPDNQLAPVTPGEWWFGRSRREWQYKVVTPDYWK